MFAVWLLSPFVTKRKTFHSAVVFKRVLVMLVTLQVLRIITFLSTQVRPVQHACSVCSMLAACMQHSAAHGAGCVQCGSHTLPS